MFRTVTYVCASFILVCGLSFGSAANAQTKVALVDIGQVFKSHPVFAQQLDGLKKEAEQFKVSTQQLQQQLMSKAEVLKSYEPSSAEFRNAETELAKESAAMEVQQRDKMRVLMEREAKLHYDTYMEIKQLISMYCEQTGTKLVLRFNNIEMKPGDAASIMQRVNENIVYNRPGNDITTQIVAQLAQQHSSAKQR
jgi:Skp family chaperone for outer membrane proteins